MSQDRRPPASRRTSSVALAVAVLLGLGALPALGAPASPSDAGPSAAAADRLPTKSTAGHNRITDDPEAAAKALEHAPYRLQQRADSRRRDYFVELRETPLTTIFDAARSDGASVAAATEQVRQARARVGSTSAAVRGAARRLDDGATHLYDTRNAVTATVVRTTAAAAAALSRRRDVASVRAIVPKTISNASTDEFTGALAQWQSIGLLGTGVSIGIIDTGIDYTHAAFGGAGTGAAYEAARTSDDFAGTAKVVGGHDFVGDAYNGNNLPQPDANPLDCQGHGTHVAATAAGYGVQADGSTFAGDYSELDTAALRAMKIGPGAAPEADLYALRVFGCSGSSSMVPAALDWALDPDGDLDFSDRLDVVNLSLGTTYAPEDDPENAMIDALAAHGVLSVVASGNDGDLTGVGGSPGNALTSLTVANSRSGLLPYDGITVEAPGSVAGVYPGQYSVLYEPGAPVTGEVVRLGGPGSQDQGCDPYTEDEAAAVLGKVVWLHWPEDYACGSVARADQATAAGAVGVLLSAEVDAFTAGVGGNAAIPMFQLTATATAALQPALDAGELEVRFDFQTGSVVAAAPDVADTLNPGSSRGSYGARTTVKPDVAAPGTQILSAAVGGGTEGAVLSGTSMATPHVAGIAATLRQAHPSWRPELVKAAVMNTAVHDVTAGELVHAPGRVGSGRVDAAYATSNDVLVYSPDQPGGVSASFGVVEAPIDGPVLTRTRTIRVENTGTDPIEATLSYAEATSQPGVSYTVSPSSLSVPAGATRDAELTVRIDPAQLDRRIDPTMQAEQSGVPRQFVTTASGRLLVDLGSGAPLRLPVSTAAKPVSSTVADLVPDAAAEPGEPATGEVRLTGTGVDQGDYLSIGAVLEAGGTSPRKPQCDQLIVTECTIGGADASGDLRAVGATSDYPVYGDDVDAWAVFAVNTWANWSAPGLATVPFVDIWTESDPATEWPDYELFVAPYFLFDLDIDHYAAVLVHVPSNSVVYDLPVNLFDGETDTGVFDSDTILLATPLAALYAGVGAPASSLDQLSYQVGTFSRFGYGSADILDLVPASGTIAFDPRNPGIFSEDGVLMPDLGGVSVPVTKAAGSDPARVLVTRLHGATGERAQVLDWPAADTEPPILVSATGSGTVPAVDGQGTVEYSWSFVDRPLAAPAGLASYDVRQRVGDGAWQQPAAWQGLSSDITSISAAYPAGTTVCFEVRARDHAGNVSAWVGGHCASVQPVGPPDPADTTAPTVTSASVPAPVLPTPRGRVTFSYAATDAGGIGDYDVQVRRAAPGKPYGPWRSPAGWTRRTLTSVTASHGPGRNLCFRVRARDRAGNTSDWSPAACTTAPYDDFRLRAKGDVTRARDRSAMQRTVTRLRSRGARLVRGGQRARTITLIAQCRPRGGKVQVRLGKHRAGTIRLRCATPRLVTRTLDLGTERSGKLRIVSRGKRTVTIDGVALAR